MKYFFLILLLSVTSSVEAASRFKPSFSVEVAEYDHNIEKIRSQSVIEFEIKKINPKTNKIFISSNQPSAISEQVIILDKPSKKISLKINWTDFAAIDNLRISLSDKRTAYKNEKDLFWGSLGKFYPRSCEFDLAVSGFNIKEPDQISCGDVLVKENRSKEDSRYITVHAAELLGTNPSLSPIVSLEGGPGDEFSPEAYAYMAQEGLIAGRTLIMIDQRGIGRSSPFPACKIPLISELFLDDGLNSLNQSLACLDKWKQKVDLAAYNTKENADDVAELVANLGYEKVVILGVSYGSRLGLELIRRHPDIVEASLLSGIDSGVDYDLSVGKAVSDSLTNVVNLCVGDSECNSAYPDLDTKLEELFAKKDLAAYKLLVNIFFRLYSKSGAETIPQAIYLAEKNKLPNINVFQRETSPLMSFSTVCSDAYPVYNPVLEEERLSLVRPELQKFFQTSQAVPEMCSNIFAYTDFGTAYYQPISSEIPTLIVQGALDHVTPVENARTLQTNFVNSRLVEFPQGFHAAVTDTDCSREILKSFFTNLSPNNIDTTCVTDTVNNLDWVLH